MNNFEIAAILIDERGFKYLNGNVLTKSLDKGLRNSLASKGLKAVTSQYDIRSRELSLRDREGRILAINKITCD
jgi:hypothetical protein